MKPVRHPCCDLHTHTTWSDGELSPKELLRQAAEHLRYLAITDHDRLTTPEDLEQLNLEEGLTLIPGAEISCTYQTPNGRKTLRNVHIIVLGFQPGHAPALESVTEKNRGFDRRLHVNQILARLQTLHIDLGSYDTLASLYPDTGHLGRMVLAKELVRRGYVSTIDEGFDIYLGAHGQRRCYVPNPYQYVPMEEVIQAAHADHALPILCHLYYYADLSPEEQEELVRRFAELAGLGGRPAGIEVMYGRYTDAQRLRLAELAGRYGLLPSAGSDFHTHSADRLDNRFPADVYHRIAQAYELFYGKKLWTV